MGIFRDHIDFRHPWPTIHLKTKSPLTRSWGDRPKCRARNKDQNWSLEIKIFYSGNSWLLCLVWIRDVYGHYNWFILRLKVFSLVWIHLHLVSKPTMSGLVVSYLGRVITEFGPHRPIEVEKIPSKQMGADMLTKHASIGVVRYNKKLLGMQWFLSTFFSITRLNFVLRFS